MQKNEKNGFLFFDLLIALMLLMIFITIICSTVSLLISSYLIQKQFLCAENLMHDILCKIESTDKFLPKVAFKIDGTDFIVTVEVKYIEHSPFFEFKDMKVFNITVQWVNYCGRVETLKVVCRVKE